MLASIKNWLKGIITILLILFFNLLTHAQEQRLLAEVDFKTGLQSSSVRCVATDLQKRIWVGTDNGLNILNAEGAAQQTVMQRTGNVSIWGINFLDSLVFIGTRLDGLYVFNRLTGKLITHHTSDQITLIRKIKIFNNQVYILSNNGVFVWNKKQLIQLKFTGKTAHDFPTDAFLWKGNIYALVYPTWQIIKLANGAFEENNTAEFIPHTPRRSLLCAYVKNNTLVIGGDNFYLIKEKDSEAKIFELPNSLKEQFVVLDIAITDSKIILALGENLESKKGLLYFHGDKFSTIGNEDYSNGFLTCLNWDKDNDRLLYGDLNNGLYWQKFISTTSTLVQLNKSREITNRGEQLIYSTGDMVNTSIFKKNNSESVHEIFKNVLTANLFGDTLAVAHEKNLKIYNAKTLEVLKTIFSKNYIPAGLVSIEKIQDNLFLFYNYIDAVLKVDLKTSIVTPITTVQSFLPKTKKYRDKIIFFNSEKGFNSIDNSNAFSFSCSDKSIAFAEDFEPINNYLYVLVRGKLKTFYIDYTNRSLVPKGEIGLQNFVEGFEPKWLLSKKDQLYLVNEKGMLQLNLISRRAGHYYYFGNYHQINKPRIDGDSLLLATDHMLSKIAFSNIDAEHKLANSDVITFNYPNTANENLAFAIDISHKDFQIQNHSLKYVDVRKNGKLVMRNYSITNRFSFAKGLTYGNYDLEFNIGNKQFHKEIEISLPLNRNPYFFGAIILFIIIIGLLYVKGRLDKKEYNKQLMQNRLQILKQNLNPHFVFNSMNLISSLILEEEYTKAVEVVAEFSNLQRTYLETNNKEFITLSEELSFLQSYLKLQQTRFHHDNDFVYQLTISEEIDTGAIILPPLILQPLAENAIKYGIISSGATDKRIWIDVRGHSPVIVSIEDNGEQIENGHKGCGLGQQLVQERIQLFKHTVKTPIKLYLNAPLRHGITGYRVEVHIG